MDVTTVIQLTGTVMIMVNTMVLLLIATDVTKFLRRSNKDADHKY